MVRNLYTGYMDYKTMTMYEDRYRTKVLNPKNNCYYLDILADKLYVYDNSNEEYNLILGISFDDDDIDEMKNQRMVCMSYKEFINIMMCKSPNSAKFIISK